ncbi:MAG: hypothetical protein ACYTXE_44200, partial [Nostoc sp.]
LFEPITPEVGIPINPSPAVPDPVVVQAYFALISNVGSVSAPLTLTFHSTANGTLTLSDTFYVFDFENALFTPNSLAPITGNKGVANLAPIPAGETALFLLQPNIESLLAGLGTPPDITKAKAGLRGYVEVNSSTAGSSFLISPATRGTFLTLDASGSFLQVVSEEAYSLQTPTSNKYNF